MSLFNNKKKQQQKNKIKQIKTKKESERNVSRWSATFKLTSICIYLVDFDFQVTMLLKMIKQKKLYSKLKREVENYLEMLRVD